MTIVRVAPRPVLSGDGRAGIVVRDGSAFLFDTTSGSMDRVQTPTEAGLAALDSTGSRCVISGDDYVSLWQCRPLRALTTVRIRAPLSRLAVDGELVAGVMAGAGDGATLLSWQGDALGPGPGSAALGPSSADELHLDGARRRLLITGLRGPQSRLGEGAFFVRLYDLGGKDWRPIWQGEGAPRHPNGFVFPLAGGALGAYDRQTLTVLSPADTSGSGRWPVAGRYRWGDLEQLVASPSGKFAAWFWSGDDGDRGDERYRARVAGLRQGNVIQDLTIERVGEFPALAVEDAGKPTLVFGERPDRVIVCSVQAGALRPAITIDVPRAGART